MKMIFKKWVEILKKCGINFFCPFSLTAPPPPPQRNMFYALGYMLTIMNHPFSMWDLWLKLSQIGEGGGGRYIKHLASAPDWEVIFTILK